MDLENSKAFGKITSRNNCVIQNELSNFKEFGIRKFKFFCQKIDCDLLKLVLFNCRSFHL